jgi:hypothetical protein
MSSKGLITSGVRWGLSCEVDNEASMGVVLGYMTLLGATNIAWAPLDAPRKTRGAKQAKNPKAVEAGRKGGLARARKAKNGRKPAEAIGAQFLRAHHGDFTATQINAVFEKAGYSSTRAYSLVNRWIKAGTVKRTAVGQYSNLTGRKTATAA